MISLVALLKDDLAHLYFKTALPSFSAVVLFAAVFE
jgi:hypothetical protein